MYRSKGHHPCYQRPCGGKNLNTASAQSLVIRTCTWVVCWVCLVTYFDVIAGASARAPNTIVIGRNYPASFPFEHFFAEGPENVLTARCTASVCSVHEVAHQAASATEPTADVRTRMPTAWPLPERAKPVPERPLQPHSLPAATFLSPQDPVQRCARREDHTMTVVTARPVSPCTVYRQPAHPATKRTGILAICGTARLSQAKADSRKLPPNPTWPSGLLPRSLPAGEQHSGTIFW